MAISGCRCKAHQHAETSTLRHAFSTYDLRWLGIGAGDQAFAALLPLPGVALPVVLPPAALPWCVATGLPPVATMALSRRWSRLRFLEAAFLWMVCLAATLSSRLTTPFSASRALLTSPPLSADRNDLTSVLTRSLRARLRARRLMLCRMRFFADSEWAT